MKSAQFLATAKMTRASVQLVQDGSKGYKMVMSLTHKEEDGSETKEEVIMVESLSAGKDDKGKAVYNHRYFKSLNGAGKALKEAGVMKFNVVMSKEEIEVTPRQKQAEQELAKADTKTDNKADTKK